MSGHELLIADLCESIRIPSVNPPGGEGPVAEYLARRLRELGAVVELQEVAPGRPNVIGIWRFGPGPSVMLTSHMDVVPARPVQFEPRIAGGRLYGRGTCDAKGPLISMLHASAELAARAAAGQLTSGSVILAAVVGEEGGGQGTLHLVKHGPRPDFAIVGEPSQLQVVLGHRGSYRRRVHFQGISAHSSDPSKGVNAIYRAARFVLEVEALNLRLNERKHPHFPAPCISANVIQGGSKVIVIADHCAVELDRRLVAGEDAGSAEAEVVAILESLHKRDPGLTWQFEDLGMDKAPCLLAAEHPLATAAVAAVASVLGQEPVPTTYAAGTDMTFLMAANIPTLILGPGDIGHAHTSDEFVKVSQLHAAAEIYAEICLRLFAAEHGFRR